MVPNPGFCRKGIHSRSTSVETKNVASPILSGEFSEIPSASTVHGELPIFVTTKNASPIPKIVRPNINIKILCRCLFEKPIDQAESARQGVIGMVFDGLINLVNFLKRTKLSSNRFTAKL